MPLYRAPKPQVVKQAVSTQTGAYANGTTLIPLDDTIPQNDEGDEYMTLAITPTNASHKLRIDVSLFLLSGTANRWTTAALFQDSTANALAAQTNFVSGANTGFHLSFSHIMTAGTTSATTFKVRAGLHQAGTLGVNGSSTARLLGGVMASGITITEYVP
jgi:hypothetical protein